MTKVVLRLLILSILMGCPLVMAVEGMVGLKISRIAGATHMEFSGNSSWNYEVTRKPGAKSLILMIPRLDGVAKEKILNYKDTSIEKIEYVGDFFDTNEKYKITLKHTYITSFDYLTEQPNNLVIDLFKDEKLHAKFMANKKRKQIDFINAKKRKNDIKLREPSASEFFKIVGFEEKESVNDLIKRLEAEDDVKVADFNFEFFQEREDAVIDAKGNIYLRFPMLDLNSRHLSRLRSSRPEYEIKPKKAKENLEARFLLSLYKKNRWAAYLRGFKAYQNKYPKTEYKQILGYMAADSRLNLWEKTGDQDFLKDAIAAYSLLLDQYKDSPLRERTLLLVALLAKDHINTFTSVKKLKRFVDEYPDSPFNNQAKILLSGAYVQLRSYDAATEVLEKVEREADLEDSIEAIYRKGDIAMARHDYRSAEDLYNKAVTGYPGSAAKFPNAHFNMAESQFIIGEFKKSLVNYGKFIKNHPRHEHSSYAMTRIGELLEIMGYGEKVSRGFLNESHFRYRGSQGGEIAHLRLLSRRMKDMKKKKELDHAVKKMREGLKKLDLLDVEEFVTFLISDGFYKRGNYRDAFQELAKYFQREPKPSNKEKFEKRIARYITAEAQEMVGNKEYIKALKLIQDNRNTWLKKVGRIDLRYLEAIAYEKTGVFDKALDIYSRVKNRLHRLIGTKEHKERMVVEKLPKQGQLDLRIASINYQLEKYKKAKALISNIKDEDLEDIEVYEKTKLDIDVLADLGENKKVLAKLKGAKEKYSSDKDRYNSFSIQEALILKRDKKYSKSIAKLNELLGRKLNEGQKFKVMRALFNNYRILNKEKEAISTGDQITKEFPTHDQFGEIIFSVGEIHFKKKNYNLAKKKWGKIKENTFWDKMAKSKLEEIDWKKEYKNYINRIPAMNKGVR